MGQLRKEVYQTVFPLGEGLFPLSLLGLFLQENLLLPGKKLGILGDFFPVLS